MAYFFDDGDRLGVTTDLTPAKKAFDFTRRAYLTLAVEMEMRFPNLPGTPALFNHLAKEAEEDEETLTKWIRRFDRSGPSPGDEFDEDVALPGQPRGVEPEIYIRGKFIANPTHKGAFDLMVDVEQHVDDYIEVVKSLQRECQDIEGFDFLTRLQQRVNSRKERLTRFATRLSNTDDMHALLIVDVMLECVIP